MTLPTVRFLPEAVERIRLNRQSFPLIHGQIRRVVLSRCPYSV